MGQQATGRAVLVHEGLPRRLVAEQSSVRRHGVCLVAVMAVMAPVVVEWRCPGAHGWGTRVRGGTAKGWYVGAGHTWCGCVHMPVARVACGGV